jgi:hypothetical protein
MEPARPHRPGPGKGKALSTAAAFGIDDVIDPARTRQVLIETLGRTRS